MLICAGSRDVHIAGGVPASEMPMHWVNQSDSTCLDTTSMTGSSLGPREEHVGYAVERVNSAWSVLTGHACVSCPLLPVHACRWPSLSQIVYFPQLSDASSHDCRTSNTLEADEADPFRVPDPADPDDCMSERHAAQLGTRIPEWV